MADAQLKAVITAEDKASKVIEGVSGSLQKTQGALEKAKGASQAFALGLAGVAAAGLAAGAKAIGAAQESVLVQKQLEAVLKSTGNASGLFKEDILEQAAALQKLTNFNDEAIVSSANLLLTFTNIKGPIMQKAIETTLDMSAALGQDLKSSAIQLGKALNDPVEGLNALRRVGVSFSDDQKKVIEKLVETGQTAKAQQVILDELAKEFGGSAQAQAEPIAQLKNSIDEAWEAIGRELLPIVNKFAKAIQNLVDEHIDEWISKTKDILKFLKEHKEVIIIVAGAIIGGLVPAIYAAVVAFGIMAIELAPFLLGGALVGALVAGILWIIKHWEDIQAKALEIWEAITSYLKDQWEEITGNIQNTWNSIKDFLTNAWQEIVSITTTTWGGITQFFSTVWDGIVAAFKFYLAFLAGLVIIAFNAMGIDIVAVLQTTYKALLAFWEDAKSAYNTSLEFIKNLWNTVWTAVRDFFTEIWAEITAQFNENMQAINTVWQAVWNSVAAFISPIWEAIKNTITAGWTWIKGKFDESSKPMKDGWNSLWNGFRDVVGSTWDWIVSKVTEGVNKAIEKINRLIGGINSIANTGAKALGISIPNIPSIKSVNDAIISPRGQIITTHPDDYLIATKNPSSLMGGGSITINVYGDVSGRELIDKVKRGIMTELKFNAQV